MRMGIIGGGFGTSVHLPAFRAAGAVIAATSDSGSGRARVDGIPYFTDWRHVLDLPGLEAVSIAAPPALHAQMVIAALDRGLHVLCEKPFGRDVADAAAMAAAARGRPQVCAVDYQFRFEPGLSEMKRLLDQGAVGALRRIDVRWVTAGRADPSRPWGFQNDAAAGGGVIRAFLCHVVDYALWLANSPAVRVWGRSDILIPRRPSPDGPRAVTAEDSVDVAMELENGVVVSAHVTNCQPGGDGHRVEISGEKGSLVWHHRPPFGAEDAELVLRSGDGGSARLPLPAQSGDDTRLAAVSHLAARFAAAVGGGGRMGLPGFDDGLRVHAVLDALGRAIRTANSEFVERGRGT